MMAPRPPVPDLSQKEALSKYIRDNYEPQLKELVEQNVRMAVDREKIFQFACARRNDYYYRGNQHLAPTFTGTGELIDYQPVNNQMLLSSGNQLTKPNTIVYDYVINNFRGDLRKFVGVLGQKSPNVTARSDWPGDETGTRRARLADDCAQWLKGQWDVDGQNRYLALSLGKNGTTFIHTSYVTDAERFGTHSEPVWELQAQKSEPDYYQCPNCQSKLPTEPPPTECPDCQSEIHAEDFHASDVTMVPVQTGTKDYPNGTVEMEIHSIFDVTTPFYVKDLEHCPWLWLENEQDQGKMIQKFPNRGLEERMGQGNLAEQSMGGSSSSLGRLARVQASSPTGYGMIERPNRWTYAAYWLRPSVYNYLLKQGEKSEQKDTVQFFKSKFPNGMRLEFVDGVLVDVDAERLDEVWAAVKPETSEYLFADPIFNDYIQGADVMNDSVNMQIQIMETSIPSVLYNPEVLDERKIRNGFQPNEFIPTIDGAGASIQNAFAKLPVSDPKPELYLFNKTILDTMREIIGMLPAVFGGEGPSQTAEEARRKLNQALMVLATTWNEMRNGWAKAYRNGVRQLSKYSLGRLVSSQGDAMSVTVKNMGDLQELLEGGWNVESDQAIPMNWTQLRDFVTQLFTGPPEMAQALGAMDPNNLAQVQEAIGLPGWKIPGLDERDAVRKKIEQLIQGSPTPDPTGESPVGLPSVEFNPFMFEPAEAMALVKDWLLSDGQSLEGTPGFENVLAWGLAAAKAAAPPPPPPGSPEAAQMHPGAKGVPGPRKPNPARLSQGSGSKGNEMPPGAATTEVPPAGGPGTAGLATGPDRLPPPVPPQ